MADLSSCRQGDIIIDEFDIVVATGEGYFAEGMAAGVIITQTCDIIRARDVRKYVQVSPAIEVDEEKVRRVKRLHFPQFATNDGLAQRNLIVDLDIVMTIEKSSFCFCLEPPSRPSGIPRKDGNIA
jgi:hypothetical protein